MRSSFEVVTLVSAARGLPALRQLLAQLPSGFPAPVVCLAPVGSRDLEQVRAATRMRVQWALPGVVLERGTVYLSPPQSGLVFRPDGTLSVTPVSIDSVAHNPVDHFLTSAAHVHGDAAACLVLAGMEGDGVAGSLALKQAHAPVLVLDRATALHWGFAEPMVRAGAVERVLTLAEATDALRACFGSRDLLRCAEIQIRLGELLDTALAMSGTRMGHITRGTGDASRLQVLVYRGLGAHFLEKFDPIPVDADACVGRAFMERTRIVVPDVMQAPDYAPRRQDALLCGFRAVHATPIPASPRRAVYGVLTTLFVQPHDVSPHEARDMDVMADEAGRLVALVA